MILKIHYKYKRIIKQNLFAIAIVVDILFAERSSEVKR